VKATISGLKSLRTLSDIARLRNKSISEITGREEK
jgi:small subunit ribosomal protein S5